MVMDATHVRGKEKHDGHAARRGHQPTSGQPVHEPFPQVLAAHRATAEFSAQVIDYADDFVIVSRGHAAEAMAWTKEVMGKLGLTLNEAKTSVRNARKERFNFLGYTFGPHRHWKTGRQYLGASPSKKSVATAQGENLPCCLIAATRRHGRGARTAEQHAAGLVRLLQLWRALVGVRAIDNHVLTRSQVPGTAAQAARARHRRFSVDV